MSKATQTTPPRSNSGRPQSEISRLAEDIAKLWQVRSAIDVKRAHIDQDNPGDLPDGRKASLFFGAIDDRAYDRITALEREVGFLEPETLDDVLTQVVLLAQEVDCFISNYTDETFVEPALPRPTKTDRDQARFEEEQGRINRLFNAVTRGLMKFTSSPLTDSDVYFSKRCDPNTWEEDLALAEAELAKLPIKCEDALDPQDCTTHH